MEELFTAETVLLVEGFRWTRLPRRWDDYVKALRQALKAMEGEPYRSLRLLAGFNMLRTVVVLGDDPALEPALGRDRVVHVYGSPWRLRCPKCGTVVRLEEPPTVRPSCPRCGALLEPEPGDRPVKRMLEKAVAEVTTASPLLVGSVEKPTYLLLTLTVAASRLGVTVYCDSTLPDWLPCKRLHERLDRVVVDAARRASLQA